MNTKWETYVIVGVFNFAMLVLFFFRIRGDGGKTLEEVEDIFTGPLGPKYVGTLPWKMRFVTRKALLLERGEGVDAEKMAHFEHGEGERSGSDTHV